MHKKEQSTFKTAEWFDLKGIEIVDSLFLLHIILVLCHIQGMTSSSSLLAAGLNNRKSAALVVCCVFFLINEWISGTKNQIRGFE